jgi:hypothetical protein
VTERGKAEGSGRACRLGAICFVTARCRLVHQPVTCFLFLGISGKIFMIRDFDPVIGHAHRIETPHSVKDSVLLLDGTEDNLLNIFVRRKHHA